LPPALLKIRVGGARVLGYIAAHGFARDIVNTPAPPPDHSSRQACVLAMVAGFSDTVGFLTFGAFAGLMSGNTVLLGIALASGRMADAGFHLVIIATFLGGLALSTLLSRALPMVGLVVIEGALLLAAALLPALVAAPVLALAMGIQNSMAMRFEGLELNTVFVTGDLQKLIHALVERATRKPGEDPPPGRPLVIVLLWVGYIAGAALGAAAHAWLARPLLLAPLLLSPALMMCGRGSRDPLPK
jgi:uncharacterized membrane protein YoaK (UPF0700 family)